MPVVVTIVIIAVVLAVLAYVLVRRGSTAVDSATGPEPATEGGVRPVATDFHVDHGEAHVFFSVPVDADDVDPVLREILLREAVEVLRAKRSKLPLEGVSRVHAHAVSHGEPVDVGHLSLDGPGELPPPVPPGEHPLLGHHHGPDVFAEFGSVAAPPPEVADRLPSDELPPLGADLRLTTVMETGLRTQGIDPHSASMSDLVPGVLKLAGYTVTGTAPAFTATRAGTTHFVEVVDHHPGEHPELSERAVNEFMVHFGQSGAERGLLFSPKYGPFMVYDKERREPRVRFVTRERFQPFLDATALG